MKKALLIIAIVFASNSLFAWGKTGHRVVGNVAYQHLTPKAKKNIQSILRHEHLNMVGNYMDFIKSDKKNDFMSSWHYCTVPDGKTYDEVGAPDEGDAVVTVERLIAELKSKEFTYESELENLKYLVHIVADMHQPLHVGNGEDRGGNDVKLEFMWKKSNLHRVWDSGLIDYQQLSFSEYTQWINHTSEDQVRQWQSEGTRVWLEEAMNYRDGIYELPDDGKLSWVYNYTHIATVNERLLKAGVRLAGILNEIYG